VIVFCDRHSKPATFASLNSLIGTSRMMQFSSFKLARGEGVTASAHRFGICSMAAIEWVSALRSGWPQGSDATKRLASLALSVSISSTAPAPSCRPMAARGGCGVVSCQRARIRFECRQEEVRFRARPLISHSRSSPVGGERPILGRAGVLLGARGSDGAFAASARSPDQAAPFGRAGRRRWLQPYERPKSHRARIASTCGDWSGRGFVGAVTGAVPEGSRSGAARHSDTG
jgi:hypothetical protein